MSIQFKLENEGSNTILIGLTWFEYRGKNQGVQSTLNLGENPTEDQIEKAKDDLALDIGLNINKFKLEN